MWQNRILPFWCFKRMSLPACLMGKGVDSVMQMTPRYSSMHRLFKALRLLPSTSASSCQAWFVLRSKRNSPLNSVTQQSCESLWARMMPNTPPVEGSRCKSWTLAGGWMRAMEPFQVPAQMLPWALTAMSSGQERRGSEMTRALSKREALVADSKVGSMGGKVRAGASQREQSYYQSERQQSDHSRRLRSRQRIACLSMFTLGGIYNQIQLLSIVVGILQGAGSQPKIDSSYLAAHKLSIIARMIAKVENGELQLSHSQQRHAVLVLSVGFLSIFSAYSPLQTIVTKLYTDFHHPALGPLSITLIYVNYAFFSSLAPVLINRVGIKLIFLLGAMAFSLYELSGLIIYLFGQSWLISVFTVVVFSSLCGAANACVWVAQSNYIGIVSQARFRDEMFGLFFSFRSLATLLGYLINLYVLPIFSEDVYFKVLIPVGGLSLVVFLFLPYNEQIAVVNKGKEVQKSWSRQIKDYFSLLGIVENYEVYIYSATSGVSGAVGACLLYKIALNAVPQRSAEVGQGEYTRWQNYYLGMFLFFYGLAQTLMGLVVKRLFAYANCYQMTYYIGQICLVLTALNAAAYYLRIFALDCVASFLWGLAFTLQRVNVNSLFSTHFRSNLNLLGILQLTYSMSFAVFSILIAVCNGIDVVCTFALLGFSYWKIREISKPIYGYGEQQQRKEQPMSQLQNR